jgi:hypothetical protein
MSDMLRRDVIMLRTILETLGALAVLASMAIQFSLLRKR